MSISVLMSVYYKEKPQYLDECFQSLFDQSVSADEIICVKDGVLTPELDLILDKWSKILPLKVVGYENNHGLAYALNFGLRFCSKELIARMDTDDIADNMRFQKQLNFMRRNPNVVVCSGYVKEFYSSPTEEGLIKKLPIAHKDIYAYAHFRNPFNHMAVCFRKEVILAVGGYEEVTFFEDYDLWIRLLQKKVITENIPEILVNARIGNDMIGRRHGLDYVKKELYFLKKHFYSGFFSKTEYIRFVIFRIIPRLLPKRILKCFYNFLRK
ncbi:glycosyltransferase [Treponema denticola]|uniref:glycosyltransferase n=1 Tax=Treponema denticola TaxID=158 RepID=UPI0021040844|nr:glycosyltransferase [Treponema denticola]UTY23931.1 glycosyltransferase [Treponema denticola]